MKVFVAGGTGAIGRQLVPRLVAAGHQGVSNAKAKREREHASWRQGFAQ
jgi:nucleoside-diphosphate-sugar epimerase